MAFQRVNLNIAGGIGKRKGKGNNNTDTVNLVPTIDDSGNDKFILTSFAGQKHLETTDDALAADLKDRGITNVKEVIYRVSGIKLLKVTKDLIQTEIGEITGTERCIFATDGLNLVIVNGEGDVFIYDVALDTLSVATDTILVDNFITSVSILNNQFIYTTSDFFYVSDVNLPDEIFPLNKKQAQSNPDDITRGYVYNSFLYIFGKRTIEMFNNTGRNNPPFERMNGSIFQVGLGSLYSIDKTDKFLYFLGDDQKVYRMVGTQHQEVSNDSLVRQIQKLDKIDDASGFTFTFNGVSFYAITFPESKKTFCCVERYGKDGWFELNSGDYNEDFFIENTYNVASFLEIFNKRIMADLNNGKLYELDEDTYTNDSKPILRSRTLPTVDSSVLGIKGKLMHINRAELFLEKGIGNIVGEGSNPKLIFEASVDGGNTFKTIDFVKMGRFGESNFKCEIPMNIKCHSVQFRIKINESVYVALYSMSIDAKIAGR